MAPVLWLLPMPMLCVVADNVTAPVALSVAPCTKLAVTKLPALTLPVALDTPVIYSPDVANTATFAMLVTLTAILLLPYTLTLLLPFCMLVASMPVSCDPLPKM